MGSRLYERTAQGQTYAGTTDLIAVMDGEVWLLDWKTGTKPRPKNGYPEWGMQTAAYRNADGRPQRNGVVHLDKNTGLCKLYDFSERYEQDLASFRHLVAFWRSRHIEEDGLPSATTVLNLLDKPALVYWSANCACDYILDEVEELKSVNIEDLRLVIDGARKKWRKVSKKAMDVGSQVHAAIEHFLKTGEEPQDVSDEVEAGFLAFLEFQDKHKLKPIDIELVVYGN